MPLYRDSFMIQWEWQHRKIWSLVLWGSQPRMTVLVRTSSNLLETKTSVPILTARHQRKLLYYIHGHDNLNNCILVAVTNIRYQHKWPMTDIPFHIAVKCACLKKIAKQFLGRNMENYVRAPTIQSDICVKHD
jgi:hypothetical protein